MLFLYGTIKAVTYYQCTTFVKWNRDFWSGKSQYTSDSSSKMKWCFSSTMCLNTEKSGFGNCLHYGKNHAHCSILDTYACIN